MATTNNNVSRDALKKVETVYNKALRRGDKVLLGLLGPAYKQIKAAANLITPDAKEIYSASKKVIKNPNVANVTNLGITLGTEVLPTAAAAKPLIRSSRRGNQPMSKVKAVKKIVEKVTGKSKKPTRTPTLPRAGRTRRNTPKVPKGESKLDRLKEEAAKQNKAAAENRAKVAAAKKKATAAAAKKKAAAEKRAKAAKDKKQKLKSTPTTPNKMETKIEFKKGKGNDKGKILTPGRIAAIAAAGTVAGLGKLKNDAQKAKNAAKEKAAKEKAAKEKAAKEKAAAAKESKVNQAKRVSKEQSDPVSKKDPTEGGRFAFYPGEISRKEGYETMYEVDRNKMSDEVRERLEEAELYEGDSKGGRVGKGKKKKVSQAPRGVRSAIRGFKPNMGAGKGSKRTRGTGGGWV